MNACIYNVQRSNENDKVWQWDDFFENPYKPTPEEENQLLYQKVFITLSKVAAAYGS